MGTESLMAFGYFIGIGLACIGAGIGIGRAVSSAIEAMARQPEMANQLRTNMVVGVAFAEALAIYAMISIALWKLFT